MPDRGPVAQVQTQNAVRAVAEALSEVTRGAVDSRVVAALLLSMHAERVLSGVLAGLSERIGGDIADAWGE